MVPAYPVATGVTRKDAVDTVQAAFENGRRWGQVNIRPGIGGALGRQSALIVSQCGAGCAAGHRGTENNTFRGRVAGPAVSRRLAVNMLHEGLQQSGSPARDAASSGA